MKATNHTPEISEAFTSLSIGEIVRNDYRTAKIFEKYGIDFCCGGKNKLEKVCDSKELDIKQVAHDLKEATDVPLIASQNFNLWDLDFLADYIIRSHHHYVRESIPQIRHYLQKLVSAHSEKHPEVIEISDLFHLLDEELHAHMNKEEHVLFPYIKKLWIERSIDHAVSSHIIGSIKYPILKMESEHQYAGELLAKIEKLTNEFTPPAGGCNTFFVCYNRLQEFMLDLHQHIHLENNVLFPKAIELEDKITRVLN